jgi:phage terminase small subunit
VKALFNQILSQASKDQFRQTDETLLELYCLAVLEARLAYRHLETDGRIINGRLSPWVSILEKAYKAVVSLSVRLRLGPKSRLDARSDKLKGPPPSAYELLRDEKD